MFSRRDVAITSTRGFAINSGQGPMMPCHVLTISWRRRSQSAAVCARVPSVKSNGERNAPRSFRYGSGGAKKGAISRGGRAAPANECKRKIEAMKLRHLLVFMNPFQNLGGVLIRRKN